jgi:8-oxo-dGTP pyrophosphatase MutT (NUDIX family)
MLKFSKISLDKGESSHYSSKVANILLYCEDDETVFLIKRSDNVSHPGRWCAPGGHVENDESFAEAAIRESNEEVGGLPKIQKKLDQNIIIDDNKKIVTYVCLVPLKYKEKWTPVLNDESEECKWFHVNEIPEKAFDTIKNIISDLPSLLRKAKYASYLK